MFVNVDYMYDSNWVYEGVSNMGMSGNNYFVCVCALMMVIGLVTSVWGSCIQGVWWAWNCKTSLFSEMCDQFLTSCPYMYASVRLLRLDSVCSAELLKSVCSVYTVFFETLVFVRFHDYTVAKLKTLFAYLIKFIKNELHIYVQLCIASHVHLLIILSVPL